MLITFLCRRSFAARWKPTIIPSYQKEMKTYKQSISKLRNEYKNEYYQLNKEAENKWIEQYSKEQYEKYHRDMQKYRISVCKISMHTYKHMQFLKERDAALHEKHNLRDMKLAQESLERRMVLDALEIERQKWPTKENAEQMGAEMIMPQSIISEEDYMERIQLVRNYIEYDPYNSWAI